MGKISSLVFLVFSLIYTDSSFGAGITVKNLHLYIYQTSDYITCAWTKVPEATSYEFYLYHFEHKEKVLVAHIPQPPDTEDSALLKFRCPRLGHYEVFVRAEVEPLSTNYKAEIDRTTTLAELKQLVHTDAGGVCEAASWWNDSATLASMKQAAKSQRGLCSKYVNSKIDGVTVENNNPPVKQGWWIYAYPSAPTGGSITVE